MKAIKCLKAQFLYGTGKYQFYPFQLDKIIRIAHGIDAGCKTGRDRGIKSLDIVPDRDLRSRRIDDRIGKMRRICRPRAFTDRLGIEITDALKAPKSRADGDAD